MVGEPDATMQPAPQDNQLMSKHRVLSLKPYLRLERRGQDGQHETEQPDHSASLGDSITSSTRIRFSVHTVRVVLIEIVLPDVDPPPYATQVDLTMLAVLGSRERTLEEYKILLAAADFRFIRLTPTATPFSLIEAVAA